MTETAATPDFLWLFIKMLVVLGIVLGLALVTIRYVMPKGRWNKRSRGGWVDVVGRVMLEPHKNLYLLKLAGRYLVVGSAEQSLSLILELSKEEGEKVENS